MKTLIGLSSALLATLVLIPGLSMAQPRHDVPRDCIGRGGEVMCHVPGCQRFCGHHDKGPHHPGPNHHAAPVPPPPAPHHAAPVPPPPAPHHAAPVPPPPHHRAQIDADIRRLMADNDRLSRELARETDRANADYNACIRNLPPMLRNRCTFPDHEINRIKARMMENDREIHRLRSIR